MSSSDPIVDLAGNVHELPTSWPPLATPSKFSDFVAENSTVGYFNPPRRVRQSAAEEGAARMEELRQSLPQQGPMIGRIPDPVIQHSADLLDNAELKDTNPKDGIGATKLPLSLVPATATALASLAHLDGALKYGAWNWRAAGVRASIYVDAAKRHLDKWFNGEECDEGSYVNGEWVEGSGLPHFAHALACLNILVDAQACGKLHDDRPPSVDINLWFADLTPHVAELKEKHAGKSPHHYTIEDTEA